MIQDNLALLVSLLGGKGEVNGDFEDNGLRNRISDFLES
jgi:hypothetical protein